MSLWIVFVIGLLTFAIRASCLVGPTPRLEGVRPYLARLPTAVLPALAAASLLGAPNDIGLRCGAAACAGLVAWRARSIVGAMALGLFMLWALRELF